MENRESVNPNTLVSEIAKPRLTFSTVLSFIIHIVLLGLLSISFIGECIKYKSTHPKEVIKKLEKEKAEEEKRKKQEEEIKKGEEEAKKLKEENEKIRKDAAQTIATQDAMKKEEEAKRQKAKQEAERKAAGEEPAAPQKQGSANDAYPDQVLPAGAAKSSDSAIDFAD